MFQMIRAAVFLLFLSLASTAWAGGKVVVELFTSQGCSSCPPADEFLTELAARDDLIALALHVDYWDYLGWKDDFASRQFSNRQRAYAKAAHKRTVYTPQVIVHGMGRAIGSSRQEVTALIQRASNNPAAVDMQLTRKGDILTIKAQAKGTGVGPAVIQIVRYHPKKTIAIRGGENAGKKIVYSNIVTAWSPVARWKGVGNFSEDFRIKGDEPVAVLIQTDGFGPVLAAEMIR